MFSQFPIIALLTLVGFSTVFAIVLIVLKKDAFYKDKRTLTYSLAGLLIYGALGAAASALLQSTNTYILYLILQLLFLGLGIIHLIVLYGSGKRKKNKLYWTKRDSWDKDKDSFWPEFLYSLLFCLVVSTGLLLYAFIVSKDASISSDLATSVATFMLPFLFAKTFDFSQQIEDREYEIEWEYPDSFLNKGSFKWNEKAEVYFKVFQSFKKRKGLFQKREESWLFYPANATLGDAFVLSVQEFNKKRSDLEGEIIIDLGKDGAYWWLFRRRFNLFVPSTWSFQNNLLNPDLTLQELGIEDQDFIVAIRNRKES